MANNDERDYLRLPSFFKRFSEDTSMDELRLPPEFVAVHGQELPFDCRLVMARGRQWPVHLLRIASGCHFHVGWAQFRIHNRIVHEDLLTFTLVDVGVFQVKRYKGAVDDEVSDNSYTEDVDTSDEYEPSETEADSSDDDDYASDAGVLEDDGCPTFTVTLSRANISRTLEIPYAFWQRHIRMAALFDPVYFNVDGETWLVNLAHSATKIWVKRGWRHFKEANRLAVGHRCHFKLIDRNEIIFYVWFDRA
ncbi:hypothetical protein SASPL_129594 [Salvia splendens]|uniref:TF-B3 domain-containing protein n=1 Tax=Salvia splendens TaxID=180675 RepID=A0A8X8XHF8_SALSN|nr:B3 domain-containing protein Os03g0212300-like [Salvia splendens]KAG6411511.1 hypothetical protein SASPL_129594 [Salvia splendens]